MDTGNMATVRDVPACVWLVPVVVFAALLVFVGVAPRWLELAGLTVGTYGLLTATLLGSIVFSLRPYL